MEFIFSHALLIVGGLFLLNKFGAIVGISLGLNWVNALIIGVFGYPGLILLLLLKYFF